MQFQLGKTFENTPLGCGLVFAVCIGFYILYNADHHLFVTLNLVCRPVDVVFGLQVQRLIFASFVHTSLPGVIFALLLCWRRFSCIEHQVGTLGFIVWFVWTSVLVHGCWCVMAFFLMWFMGPSILSSEVHGLFPLLTAKLVASVKESDNSTVWLWPLPFHISTRVFPLVVIVLTWLLHWDAHFDVVAAYLLASFAPWLVVEPTSELLDRIENTTAGKMVLSKLQASDKFVCRQPTGPVQDKFAAKPKNSTTPQAPSRQEASPGPLDDCPIHTPSVDVEKGMDKLTASPVKAAECCVLTLGDDDEPDINSQDVESEYDQTWILGSPVRPKAQACGPVVKDLIPGSS